MELLEVQNQLHRFNLKFTNQRKLIIQILMRGDHPLTAREVFDIARVNQPLLSFDTVYRNLNVLGEIGIVMRSNLNTRFRTRFEIPKKHCHYLVCLDCGNSKQIYVCPFRESSFFEKKVAGYQIVNHAFEIYGFCPNCQNYK